MTFRVTAKSPGSKPVIRELIATFWQGNNCIGAVTHATTVVPEAGYGQPVAGSGHSKVDVLRLRGGVREEADLVIYVRALQTGLFEVALRSRVPGEEYDMKAMGELKLVGTDFENFFKQVIDPQFASFPVRDPNLNDAEFEDQIKAWNDKFMRRLAALGRKALVIAPREVSR